MSDRNHALRAFMEAPAWDTALAVLSRHPHLMGDATTQRIKDLIKAETDKLGKRMLFQRLNLLRSCRKTGVSKVAERMGLTAPEAAGPRALEGAPREVPAAIQALGKRALAAERRYAKGGKRGDLDEMIEAWTTVAWGAKGADAVVRRHALGALSHALRERFRRTSDAADLHKALDAGREALALTPPDDGGRVSALIALGMILRQHYGSEGDASSLDEAIDALQAAIAATEKKSLRLPPPTAYLNLGGALADRFAHAGERSDLDAAITAFRRADHVSTPNQKPPALAALARGLETLFEVTGERADLDRATDAALRASERSTGPQGAVLREALARLRALGAAGSKSSG